MNHASQPGTATAPLRVLAVHDHSIPVHQGLYAALATCTQLTTADTTWAWRARLRDDPSQPATLYLPATRAGLWLRGSALQRAAAAQEVVVLSRPDQLPWLPWLAGRPWAYHAIDDYLTYNPGWADAERELLRGARHVFAVSAALASRLRERAGLDAAGITVLPNAVDAQWLAAPGAPLAPPPHQHPHQRPLAGVLGRVSSRLRLDWLLQAVEATPWLDWVLAGDVESGELDPADVPVLQRLVSHPRCRLTGRIGFERMRDIAATLDVALLPYSSRSTNPWGSPVRLFVHLPAGTPLLATPGCAQVEEFTPWVSMCHSAEELVAGLDRLRQQGFDDGLRQQRRDLARQHTWPVRAARMAQVLQATVRGTAAVA